MSIKKMSPFIHFLTLLAVPAVAQQAHYFVLNSGMPVTIERVDPIMAPGMIPSQHVHSVVGGNAFAATMDYAKAQTSTCSTVEPIADKSNYWMPILYFQDPKNGSFIRVPEQPYHKIYYKYMTYTGAYDTSIQEFPQEFRMIGGDASLRAENDTLMGAYGSGLNWYCHGNGTSGFPDFKATGFPKGFTSCPNGFAASLTMPSCWNGEDFNISNPSAHMAYPTADGIEGCPATHRAARFPQIFIEYWLNTNSFDGLYTADDNPWVLTMGDATGYGFHVDFLNGWKAGVLNATMPTCTPGNTGNPPLSDRSCFGNRGGVYTDEQKNNCMLQPVTTEATGWTYPEIDNPQGGPLTYGGVLPALPGCQTITKGPDRAVLVTCDKTSGTIEEGSSGSASSLSSSGSSSSSSSSSSISSASSSSSSGSSSSAISSSSTGSASSASSTGSSDFIGSGDSTTSGDSGDSGNSTGSVSSAAPTRSASSASPTSSTGSGDSGDSGDSTGSTQVEDACPSE